MKVLLAILFLSSGTVYSAEKLKCERISPKGFTEPIIKRCSNKEVICYIFDEERRGGITCKFKEKK